ncbi:MAG: Gldg family protein [Thermodesulfobacteriota bacterium]
MTQTMAMAKKELKAYFGSPMAAIFIGAFLLCALFSFFWLESFFARNLADIRPLFGWMPLLLLFLSAALTMRQWSEEQKMGTLEVLLTLPVPFSRLVVGKFLAVLALVGLSLCLTLGLPLTVAILGDLDWGPVLGGYLGALLMASAYIAIGLFVSSRTDNQIIALISTVLLSTLFYLPGASGVTHLLGNQAGEFFRSLGTGGRFLSIERGVIDLRDLAYYLSITAFFLAANVASLASQRWSQGERSQGLRRAALLGVVLLGANLLAANLWLAKTRPVRLDLTQQREFSISQPTRDLIENLPEPLELRGYFSEKTHPLLAPLMPRIRDLMEEYRVASGGKVKVSFVDPKFDQAAEAEANQLYGIKPAPFQVAGRYETAVVNSYFNILVRYGDQFVTLGFSDLIEARPRPDGQMEVGLRNLEYDLSKSIKKVVLGFESLDTILARAAKPMALTLVATPATLPGQLADLPTNIRDVADGLVKESQGKLSFTLLDPDAPGATLNRGQAAEKFAIQPIAASLLDKKEFFLHLLLAAGERQERVYVDGAMGPAEIRQEIEAAIKRTSSGFLKTVGIWTPTPAMEMMMQNPGGQYRFCQQLLQENYNVMPVDLKGGHVPGEVDVLLLVAPQGMNDLERLAIDQYLMRGGSVVALAGGQVLDLTPGGQTLHLRPVKDGIATLLARYGVTIGKGLVMDRQNEPFPIPVTRDLGGVLVQEIRQMAYPFFVDVHGDGMAKGNPALASLPSVTLHWPSPLTVDQEKAKGLEQVTLLASSPRSWLRDDLAIQPDFGRYPELGFAEEQAKGSQTLAVSLKGSFASAFAGQPDPRLTAPPPEPKGPEQGHAHDDKPGKAAAAIPMAPLLQRSPDSARLVVVGSSEFASDMVISIAQSTGQDRILNSLGFLQNLIDWSVEDEALLSIRSRGSHTRLLPQLSRHEQAFWEWLNYGLALLALLLAAWHGSRRHQREEPMELDAA